MFEENTNTEIMTIAEVERLPEVIQLKEKIAEAVNEAKEIEVIMTSMDLQRATNLSSGISKVSKKADIVRKEINQPYDNFIKSNNQLFKNLLIEASPQMKRLDDGILEYTINQQRIARQREADERKAAEAKAIQDAIEKEEKLKKEAVENGCNPEDVKVEVAIIPETVIEAPKLSQQNTNRVGTMKVPEWEIIDANLIPREFMMVNESKIQAHRKAAGVEAESDIPGVRFFFRETIVKR